MIELIGFDSPTPYAVIVWSKNGVDRYKTICHSEQDIQDAMSRKDAYPGCTPTINMAKQSVGA